MRKKTLVKIAYITILITVGLIGISYAGWTDMNKLVSSITTGHMNYDFEPSGNSLKLIHNNNTSSVDIPVSITVQNGKYLKIDISDTSHIMNMSDGDILRINYMLQKGSSGNVPLKGKEEDLGFITLSLNQDSVKWNYSGSSLDINDYTHLVPSTLGTYQVYHRVSGIRGEIDLIPVNLPTQPPTTINIGNNLAYEIDNIEQLHADEHIDDIVTILEKIDDNSRLEDGFVEILHNTPEGNIVEVDDTNVITEESVQSQMDGIDDKSIDKNSNENKNTKNIEKPGKAKEKKNKNKNKNKKKLLITTETLSFSAEYGFLIPLKFDQSNAE